MANTVVIFDSWKLASGRGLVNASATHRMYLLSTAPTNIDTSSFANSLSALTAKSASNRAGVHVAGAADRQMASVLWTKISDGVIRWDADDITFTASAGVSMDVQYAAVRQSNVDIPFFYWEISTVSVAATQFGISVPATGFWETSDNV